jgi:competence protein ComEA
MKLPLLLLLTLSAAALSTASAAPPATVVVSATKSATAVSSTTAAKPAAAPAAIDLNSADASTLAREMRGIGQSKARAIVEYRRIHGPFRSIDDLALVKGIGARTIELNRAKLRVGVVKPVRNAAR